MDRSEIETFVREYGHFHDAVVDTIEFDFANSVVSISMDDMHANFRGFEGSGFENGSTDPALLTIKFSRLDVAIDTCDSRIRFYACDVLNEDDLSLKISFSPSGYLKLAVLRMELQPRAAPAD